MVLGQVEHGAARLSTCSSEEPSISGQEPSVLQSIFLNAQQKILQLRQTVDSYLKDTSNGEVPKG